MVSELRKPNYRERLEAIDVPTMEKRGGVTSSKTLRFQTDC